MKILIVLLVLVSNLFTQNFSGLDSIPNFRGFEWGESFEYVKSRELAQYKQTFIGFGVNTLSYTGNIVQLNADIDYVFENNALSEGLYIVNVSTDLFKETFEKINKYHFEKLDVPHYWASSHPNSEINWDKIEENRVCRGPEIYWEYCDGFIGIIAEKFKENISITILYAHNKTILDYGKYITFPYSEGN